MLLAYFPLILLDSFASMLIVTLQPTQSQKPNSSEPTIILLE
ncbi:MULTISPECIES: hypothetical protein [unclassified Bradyrhizobium]